jgi:hypothetical protein
MRRLYFGAARDRAPNCNGDVAELADALDLGSSSFGSAGSTPVIPTFKGGSRRAEGGRVSFHLPPSPFRLQNEPVAQLVEQRTFNPWVVGSSPAGLIVVSAAAPEFALARAARTRPTRAVRNAISRPGR